MDGGMFFLLGGKGLRLRSEKEDRSIVCGVEVGVFGGVEVFVLWELNLFEKVVDVLMIMFFVWVIFGMFIGIYKLFVVIWLNMDLFMFCLGFFMFFMGFIFIVEDFRWCLCNFWIVGVGFVV